MGSLGSIDDNAAGRRKDPSDLSIVIVNWNTRDMLRECLELIPAAVGDLSYEIVIVDNGSADGSVSMIREDFSSAVLIENSDNIGFPKAVNQGISASGGRYLALLNSDIMVPPDSLKEMVVHVMSRPEVAAVAPQLIGRSGHMQYCGGNAPSPCTAMLQLVELQALAGYRSHGLYVRSRTSRRPQSLDWLCAACMVIDRKAVDDAGMFDELHFMYGEDVEFGLRLRRSGWKLKLLPWIRVVHYGRASSSGAPEARLMWLGGVFRIASQRLSRPRYTLFGIFLSLAFFTRYLIMRMMKILPGGRSVIHTEVANQEDVRLYARTAWTLAMSEPQYAGSFCSELENSYRKTAAEAKS
ncbi:MAG: glycosyltransferase family 2 protein [Thermoleophilia bacterium]|nr:glycosyltransferase family 2 protein [Thermoleophilia bacterium]